MKKVLALILTFMSVITYAQTPVNGDYLYNGRQFYGNYIFLPVRDTVGGLPYRVGATAIRPADTLGHPLTVPVYVWTGSRWENVSATGGGGLYTAGNGLSLSGTQFLLGGTLTSNTNIATGVNRFAVNYGGIVSPSITLSSDTTKIGYNEPNGNFSGYEYVKDYGRGKHLFLIKGNALLLHDYQGLTTYDTLCNSTMTMSNFNGLQLKQSNGNDYLNVSTGKLLLNNTTDTAFYADENQVVARALINADPSQFITSDEFGHLKLVAAPGTINIGNSDLTLTGNRSLEQDGHNFYITQNTDNSKLTSLQVENGNIDGYVYSNPETDPFTGPASRSSLQKYFAMIGAEGAINTSYHQADSTRVFMLKTYQNVANGLFRDTLAMDSSGVYYSHRYDVGATPVSRKIFKVDTSGNLFAGKITAAIPTPGATYQRSFAFSTDGIDTTKQLWSMGLVGAPTGAPFHNGGTLVFRAYTSSGAVLADRLTIPRAGNITTPSSIQVGTGTFTFSTLGLNSSTNVSATQLIQAGQGIINIGSVIESATTTVTGDYTVISSDLYVNVNNTSDCTITIPAALATSGAKGRVLYIKKISNNAFNVNIVVSGGTQTIDGGSSIIENTFNKSYHLHDDGSNWFTY